ncbi:MAG: hypothetical protein IT458_05270 [Planctomycetes bacterium]|nr:hypothetical protein [Planctomycetota bacterium]
MTLNRLLPVGLCLAVPAFAQATITTAPAGYEATVGTSSVLYPWSFTSATAFRYQEIHTSLKGAPLANIKAANFRRDESASTFTTSVARTQDVTFKMGHGNIAVFQTNFNANYTGAPTTVFTRKPVNLPDWTLRQGTGGVEPWTLRLPYDANFNYDGVQDLLWEVIWENSTATGNYTTDRTSSTTGSVSSSSAGANLGTGCIATGRTSAFTLAATVYTHLNNSLMRLRTSCTNAPTSTPVLMAIDAVNSNLTVPGLCTTLYALPTLLVPIGTSSATGAVAIQDISLAYDANLQTQRIYLQAIALDAGLSGIPVALSQGENCLWPAAPVTGPNFLYTYSTDITGATPTNGPFTAGSAICGFER